MLFDDPGGKVRSRKVTERTREEYAELWGDARGMRAFLDEKLWEHPELFPESMAEGYEPRGCLPESKKMSGIRLHQLRTGGKAYGLRPSFVWARRFSQPRCGCWTPWSFLHASAVLKRDESFKGVGASRPLAKTATNLALLSCLLL
jgi:hypothetical protein